MLPGMNDTVRKSPIAYRFRGFLPVVVDLETGGFNARTDALLEIAAVIVRMDNDGRLYPARTLAHHVEPFPGANIEPESLKVNGIDPYHPFRMALPETEALSNILREVRREVRETGCTRAVMVAHNPIFDLGFFNAAIERNDIKRNPFHPFSSFDTATLGGLAYGQTVLARAAQAAGIEWDMREAHSAIYDAERTAELFCRIVNQWKDFGGWVPSSAD
ncbi:RNAse T [Plasticicumulans acidivorans]|uniref:Ribonuclease T n=2 Tax=Plasticicumulans acidivorans TaxID=886464 RepID=A0A317MTQ1_9GAMM|nr:RNAse T [Plasticicumulans acidivorans]